jgi:hypothetical protein
MKCRYRDGTKCTQPKADAYGRHVPPRVCAVCDHYDGPARGAGDHVEAVTRATGLKALWERLRRFWKPTTPEKRATSCGGCAARRRALNERFPSKG